VCRRRARHKQRARKAQKRIAILLDSVERGEWKSAKGGKRERTRYVRYAKATFRKDRRLNIRLSSKDLEAIDGGGTISGTRAHLQCALGQHFRRFLERDHPGDRHGIGECRDRRKAGDAPSSSGHATAGESAPSPPEAATSSDEGVSAAATGAASGSPPGSPAATAATVCGRMAGSIARQRRMVRSTIGLTSGTTVDGAVAASSRARCGRGASAR
jgi:predicted DNA binding CopG/RHH family protein